MLRLSSSLFLRKTHWCGRGAQSVCVCKPRSAQDIRNTESLSIKPESNTGVSHVPGSNHSAFVICNFQDVLANIAKSVSLKLFRLELHPGRLFFVVWCGLGPTVAFCNLTQRTVLARCSLLSLGPAPDFDGSSSFFFFPPYYRLSYYFKNLSTSNIKK